VVVAPAGTLMYESTVAYVGAFGLAGAAEAVPCVTPSATWLSGSPWSTSCAVTHTASMRG
jgi:hypothetical protein